MHSDLVLGPEFAHSDQGSHFASCRECLVQISLFEPRFTRALTREHVTPTENLRQCFPTLFSLRCGNILLVGSTTILVLADIIPSRAGFLAMFHKILDPEEDLATEVTLILVHLLPAQFHLRLEHRVPMGKGSVRRHRDVRRGQRLVLDLINAMPER